MGFVTLRDVMIQDDTCNANLGDAVKTTRGMRDMQEYLKLH